MLRLTRYLKGFRKEVILGPLFKLTEAIFELIVPLVMARIIDVGIRGHHQTYILQMGGVLVLLGVTGLICALICQYLAAKASQGVGTVLRNDLFLHIIKRFLSLQLYFAVTPLNNAVRFFPGFCKYFCFALFCSLSRIL